MQPDGNALVVVSAGFPTADYAVADEFTSACTPDRAFGNGGSEHLTFDGQALTITAVIPAADGKTILAGSTAKGWLIARIGAGGRLDPAFGRGGSTVLPWPGSMSAIALTSSGDIVLGATAGGDCCVREWVGELNPDGAPIRSFGAGGRTAIPVYLDDSGISRVWAAPDGEILALSGGGNMGCLDTYDSALTSRGTPVPEFQSNFNAAARKVVPSQVFVADVVIRPSSSSWSAPIRTPACRASLVAPRRAASYFPSSQDRARRVLRDSTVPYVATALAAEERDEIFMRAARAELGSGPVAQEILPLVGLPAYSALKS